MAGVYAANGMPGVSIKLHYATAVKKGQVINFGGFKAIALMDRGEGTDVESDHVVAFFPGCVEIISEIAQAAAGTLGRATM